MVGMRLVKKKSLKHYFVYKKNLYVPCLRKRYINYNFFFQQFINIVVNLLDALKTSFSHRSLAARSIGKKDTVSEAAVASLTLFKVRPQIRIITTNFF